MKKTILLVVAFVTVSLVSCKKSRTCECKNTFITTSTNNSTGISETAIVDETSNKEMTKWSKLGKKNDPRNLCVSQINKSTSSNYDNTIRYDYTNEYNCTIK